MSETKLTSQRWKVVGLINAGPDLYEALVAIIEALDDGDRTATEARAIARTAGAVAVARAEGRLP